MRKRQNLMLTRPDGARTSGIRATLTSKIPKQIYHRFVPERRTTASLRVGLVVAGRGELSGLRTRNGEGIAAAVGQGETESGADGSRVTTACLLL